MGSETDAVMVLTPLPAYRTKRCWERDDRIVHRTGGSSQVGERHLALSLPPCPDPARARTLRLSGSRQRGKRSAPVPWAGTGADRQQLRHQPPAGTPAIGEVPVGVGEGLGAGGVQNAPAVWLAIRS